MDELRVSRQPRHKHRQEPARENVGIDTETYRGRAKIITDSFGRALEPENFHAILQFLSYYKYRKKFGWFWNVRFDFEAIIKWLAHENYGLTQALYFNQFVKYRDYKISYLPGKYFQIEDHQKHTYTFYDMHNFINLPLNEAAIIYLNDEKDKKIDSSRLNMDLEYWNRNKKEIIQYCKKDALLTKQLADRFWNKITGVLKFNPIKPFSKGSFSQEYFLERCFIPQVNKIRPQEVVQYAYNSCRGGRFEILQRGYFDHVYQYDIKSAYPAEMADLPAFTNGRWLYRKDFPENEYDYGFYHCVVTTFNENLSPAWYKNKGTIIFPNGQFETYLCHNEIETVLTYFPETEIEVIGGWAFHPDYQYVYPLKEEVEKIFKLKEAEKDPEIKEMYKTILNGLSGKFLQEIGGRTGTLFNPLWFSMITAGTRCKLIAMADKIGFENVIAFCQDAIHATEKTNLKKPGLGDFTLETDNWQGVYLMSNVYSVWKGNRAKNKMQGYVTEIIDLSTYTRKKKNMLDILTTMNGQTVFEWTDQRPVHLGEIIQKKHNWNVDDLNIWVNIPKRLDINGDHKRIWENRFKDSKEVFTDTHRSRPIIIK